MILSSKYCRRKSWSWQWSWLNLVHDCLVGWALAGLADWVGRGTSGIPDSATNLRLILQLQFLLSTPIAAMYARAPCNSEESIVCDSCTDSYLDKLLEKSCHSLFLLWMQRIYGTDGDDNRKPDWPIIFLFLATVNANPGIGQSDALNRQEIMYHKP